MHIRTATQPDAPPMWAIYREVAEGGDTIPSWRSISERAFASEWFDEAHTPFVAVDAGQVLGLYKLGANQPDRGAHVATATFMVHSAHRGRGVGTALVEHCLARAAAAGFAAIQFNFVVGSNHAALSLYRKFGFAVVGTLPGAFHHGTLGFIDAHVLFKRLQPAA